MKTNLYLLLFLNASILPVIAQEDTEGMPGTTPAALSYIPGRTIEMSPEQKRPLLLKEGERNPYARRSPEQENVNDEGENAEEMQIRQRLSSLSVSGKSQGSKGLRILLGDIILEQGRILPQLLLDQTQNLKVIEVSEDAVLLGWLDIETGELTGKTIPVTYDLSPSISYALHGQDRSRSEEGEGIVAERQMGVLRIGQDRKKLERQMAASDPASHLPREVIEAGQ
ncbi:MAG: hypothetical protein P1U68_13495 [Verrucomicrobiales bacterium]|nr:hypothetical protein [Verrucomicrobiales bacterium]